MFVGIVVCLRSRRTVGLGARQAEELLPEPPCATRSHLESRGARRRRALARRRRAPTGSDQNHEDGANRVAPRIFQFSSSMIFVFSFFHKIYVNVLFVDGRVYKEKTRTKKTHTQF